ncbi:metallo-beta-lactamase family protein [Enhydrobacter aerosaccus]|uniref:Metallo-beta-lactamase family protein n=1 Tax=Enhydrobacter aerosaccus TaxID=225324 RepID=A0A1T4SRI5_9HYPH|nr:MBL fold metallo-hydrolase [Enhydrobacter aerosaccus]SKA30776.1 metallo-beta-lactamase family protein [Enhydrobacter aerosaccus]
MKLSFHGADRTVTGSCHLLEIQGRRILVDCGLFQGGRELREDNAEPFGFDPASIDFVLLTHAHLDHCGRLPLLVKRGFRGEIIATAATFELARLVMLDAAHLQEEEAGHRKHSTGGRSEELDGGPLYSMLEALDAIGRFGRAVEYDTAFELVRGIRVTFLDAGHILGSASVLIKAEENGHQRSILFSGDIGNSGRPLLRSPQLPAAAEIVVMESTYGNRCHRSFAASVDEFHEAVAATLMRRGNVLIPTFALERAQEILYFLRQGIEQNRLPPSLPVFLDSPMAISATEIFRRHPECYSETLARSFKAGQDPFLMNGLRVARETAESIAINRITAGAVIMAGSGMCTGGRIRHHLRHNLDREAASVVFVGFASAGTLARQIIDGAKQVRIFGETVPVRAHVHTINGFSAHADQRELIDWHDRIPGKQATFVVHGEASVMAELAPLLRVPRVEMPQPHQQFEL